MVCPKCKNGNNNNLKCEFCGYDFINNDAGKEKKHNSLLSKICLGLLLLQVIFVSLIIISVDQFSELYNISVIVWIITLILSIISVIKNKDNMALWSIIGCAIMFSLYVVMFIWLFGLAVSSAISSTGKAIEMGCRNG